MYFRHLLVVPWLKKKKKRPLWYELRSFPGKESLKIQVRRGGPLVLATAPSVNVGPGCREASRWTHGVQFLRESAKMPGAEGSCWTSSLCCGAPAEKPGLEINCLSLALVARIWVLWGPTWGRSCRGTVVPGARRILLISEIQARNLPKSWITPRNGFHPPGMEPWCKAASSFLPLLFSH